MLYSAIALFWTPHGSYTSTLVVTPILTYIDNTENESVSSTYLTENTKNDQDYTHIRLRNNLKLFTISVIALNNANNNNLPTDAHESLSTTTQKNQHLRWKPNEWRL